MKISIKNITVVLSYIFMLSQTTGATIPDSTSRSLSLDECIEFALEMSHDRAVSKYAIEIAEAQHRQVLSSYFPQLLLNSAYTLLDQHPNFIFPPSRISIPPLNLEGTSLDFPPIEVPQQDIKLMDKHNFLSDLSLFYPLYTGGKISSLNKQARCAIEIARQEANRTDLQIIYDVKRYYYAAIMTREILDIGTEALARLEVILELTESLYQRGSGRVKKTDFLKNKMIVETIRSLVAILKYNEKLAKTALVNAMGLDWQHQVEPSETEIPYQPYPIDLKQVIASSYQFNPDWTKINAALKIMEAKLTEVKSACFPQVALFGKLEHIENSFQYGMVSPKNKDSWTIGVGLQLPIFFGFRTRNQVKETQANLNKLKEQKILFEKGLAVQIQHIFLQLASAQEKFKAVKEAMLAAEDNRNLTERAYQQELMEEKELIEAQIFESIMKAQYQQVLYDHIEAQAHLDFLVGTEVAKLTR